MSPKKKFLASEMVTSISQFLAIFWYFKEFLASDIDEGLYDEIIFFKGALYKENSLIEAYI